MAESSTATIDQVNAVTGEWTVDSAHSSIGFVVRHLMTKVRGSFGTYTGEIKLATPPEQSTAHVSIEVASIDTRDERRDGHLRSADFFDVATYPAIEFTSTVVKAKSGANYVVTGNLSLHGVSKPIDIEMEFLGLVKDPFGNEKAMFSGTTELNREEWGLSWNAALETGGVLVGKTIRVEVEAQLVRKQAAQ